MPSDWLQRLQQAEQAATRGEWKWYAPDDEECISLCAGDTEVIEHHWLQGGLSALEINAADRDLIVLLRNNAQRLLAIAEAAEQWAAARAALAIDYHDNADWDRLATVEEDISAAVRAAQGAEERPA